MFKVLLLAESAQDVAKMHAKLAAIQDVTVVASIALQEFTAETQKQYKVDAIMLSNPSATLLTSKKPMLSARQHVTARTHQGIQLVAIDNIYYFQAEHKYVTAYHTQGQLLIEDSLNSLEDEFMPQFIRIHRKILVARDKVEQLLKDAAGQYHVKLKNVETLLLVSRRQLPRVRQILLNT